MSDRLSEREYWAEVRSIVDNLVSEVRSENPNASVDELCEAASERLWETVDGHQWIIYTAYNWDVLSISPNDGYSIQEFGADSALKDGQLNTAGLAFGALYADCMERLADVEWEDLADAS